jgi:hypothetical protein
MDRIKLSNGVITLGGTQGVGKTRFALKLANHLALNEKVLFISYQDYKEKLISIVTELDGHIQENLEINTSFKYCNLMTFLDVYDYVEKYNFTTIFIDDIDWFNEGIRSLTDQYYKEASIKALLFLSRKLNVRVVFTLSIKERYDFPVESSVRNFSWSRSLVNECFQIYVLYRPYFYGYAVDQHGECLVDQIRVITVKNENHKEETIILDNSELKIYTEEVDYSKYNGLLMA